MILPFITIAAILFIFGPFLLSVSPWLLYLLFAVLAYTFVLIFAGDDDGMAA